MNRKRVAVFLIVIIALFAWAFWQAVTGRLFLGQSHEERVRVDDRIDLWVKIADDPSERAHGLSDSAIIEWDEGMLFTFGDGKVTPIFWMRGVKYPLDIIWVADGKIVGFVENTEVVSDDLADDQLTRYRPSTEIDIVLEVRAGFVDRFGIEKGDSLIRR